METIILAALLAGAILYAYKHSSTLASVKAELVNLELEVKKAHVVADAEAQVKTLVSAVESSLIKIKAKL